VESRIGKSDDENKLRNIWKQFKNLVDQTKYRIQVELTPEIEKVQKIAM
jgi:hypothetical protein